MSSILLREVSEKNSGLAGLLWIFDMSYHHNLIDFNGLGAYEREYCRTQYSTNLFSFLQQYPIFASNDV